jgi:hypothetical protein
VIISAYQGDNPAGARNPSLAQPEQYAEASPTGIRNPGLGWECRPGQAGLEDAQRPSRGLEILAQPGNYAGPTGAGEGAGLEAELAQPRDQVPAQPGDRVLAQPGDDAGSPGGRRGRRPRREARTAAQPGESGSLAQPGRGGSAGLQPTRGRCGLAGERSRPSRDGAATPAWLLYAGPALVFWPDRWRSGPGLHMPAWLPFSQDIFAIFRPRLLFTSL